MNKEKAYSILNIKSDDEDHIQDQIDQLIFQARNKIIRQPYLPKVIQIQRDKIEKWLQALAALNLVSEENERKEIDPQQKINKGSFYGNLQAYQADLKEALLEVTHARTVQALENSAKNLSILQKYWYEKIYSWLVQNDFTEFSDVEVTMAAVINPVRIFDGAQEFEQKYSGILEPLKRINFASLSEPIQSLVKEWARIYKYQQHYG